MTTIAAGMACAGDADFKPPPAAALNSQLQIIPSRDIIVGYNTSGHAAGAARGLRQQANACDQELLCDDAPKRVMMVHLSCACLCRTSSEQAGGCRAVGHKIPNDQK